MSFKDLDDHVGLRIEFDKLPKRFVGIPLEIVKGTTTKNGKEYPVNKLVTKCNGGTFPQNLRQLHWAKFKENLATLGITDITEFIGKPFVYERTAFHVSDPTVQSEDRWLPIKPHKGRKGA